MDSAIVILERALMMPKEEWRSPGCRRTLPPIAVAATIAGAWKCGSQVAGGTGVVTVSLQPDGSPKGPPSVRGVQPGQKAFLGVFDATFAPEGCVWVTLREEQCAQRLGIPKRRTRRIARLEPWKPVQILLNGRSAGTSGQYYFLTEYHLALCTGPAPDELPLPHGIDLQADLA